MTSRSRLLRHGFTTLWLAVVWIALWSELSLANVTWGVVIGASISWLVPPHDGPRQVGINPLALLRFAGYSSWALVRASAVVAWEVVTPGSQINEGIVAAPLRTSSAGVATLIGNVVSLTPGTITLEVHEDPLTLYIHVLHLHTIEEVRGEIRHLEDLALRAFPDLAPTEETA